MKKLFLGLTVAFTVTVTHGQTLQIIPCGQPVLCPPPPTPCNNIASVCAIGGTPPYTYLWNPTGQTTQTATGLCTGMYTVTVTDASSTSVMGTIAVTQANTLTVSCTANPTTITVGNSATLTATASNGTPGYTYYWSPSYTINPIVVSPTTTTCYSVTVADANGCTDTTSICLTVTPTGINEYVNNISLTISPNPFCSQTNLRTDKFFNDASLTIYNLYGETVKQIKNISGQTVTLHRDNLPSGLYFLRITQGRKVIATDKLVITD